MVNLAWVYSRRTVPVADGFVLDVDEYIKDFRQDKFSRIYNCVKVRVDWGRWLILVDLDSCTKQKWAEGQERSSRIKITHLCLSGGLESYLLILNYQIDMDEMLS